jgi:hypothetical protein
MVFFAYLGYNVRTMFTRSINHEKKILICLLGLLMSASVFAHTSINFSLNQGMPGMMDDYGYEDRLLMQQLRARRMQNRMMRMQLAQMGYPRYVRVIEPMYSNYYSYNEEPYFVRTRTVYTNQYVRQRQTHCHKRVCVRAR